MKILTVLGSTGSIGTNTLDIVRRNRHKYQVFALVADFNKHPEWDKFTKKVELVKPGDANGAGAEWKVYEQLGLFALGQGLFLSKYIDEEDK